MLEEFKNMCRLCLKKSDKYGLIISEETAVNIFTQVSFKQKLQHLFGLTDLDDLSLPHLVCEKCNLKTKIFYDFAEFIKINQKQLLEWKLSLSSNQTQENEAKLETKTEQNTLQTKLKTSPKSVQSLSPPPAITRRSTLNDERDCNQKVTESQISDYLSDDQNPEEETTKLNITDEDLQIRNFFDLSCPHCNIAFEKFSKWKNHLRIQHKEINPALYCCKKKLYRRHHLITHLTLHLNPSEFQCPISTCKRQCQNRHRLKEHLNTYHDSNSQKFQCDSCLKCFATKVSLKKHHLTHIDADEKQRLKKANFCNLCGIGFLSNSILQYHVRLRHEEKYSTVCNACGKIFRSKHNFLSHYLSTHGDGSSKKECTICHKYLSDSSSLRRHIKNKHDEFGQSYTCVLCDKQCPSSNALRAHTNYVHNDEKKYACQYCNKSFKRAIGLKEHQTIHLGGALYRCMVCDKTFNSSANMYKHRKRIHSNDLTKEKEKTST